MRLIFSLCLTLVLPVAGTAQVPAWQGAMREIQALSAVNEPAALTATADSFAGDPRPEAPMFRGLVLVRRAQVAGGRRDYESALAIFRRLLKDRGNLAEAWFGIGIVKSALGDSGYLSRPGADQPIGASWLDGAAAAYMQALEVDPSYIPAAESLAALPGRPRFHLDNSEILPVLLAALDTPAGDSAPALLLQVAKLQAADDLRAAQATYARYLRAGGDTVSFFDFLRSGDDAADLAWLRDATSGPAMPELLYDRLALEVDLEQDDSARAVLRRYLAGGGDSGAAAFFDARLLFQEGDSARGETAYYEGARRAGNAMARALYREDISWIAGPGELAGFDSIPGPDLSQWLEAFWNRRDAADARTPGTRLREHRRRYAYAYRHYRLSPRARKPGWWVITTRPLGADATEAPIDDPALADHLLTGFQSSQMLFDDRGLVYLRHGPPDQAQVEVFEHADVGSIGGAVVWRYFRPEGNLLLQFADLPFDGSAEATALASYLVAPNAVCAMTGGAACGLTFPVGTVRVTGSDLRRVNRRIHQDALVATTTDDYRPHFEAGLSPIIQLYAAGGAGSGDGVLLAVFAFPGTAIPASPVNGGFVYPVHLRLTAVSPSGASLVSMDTTRFLMTTSRLAAEQYLTGTAEMPLPPGRYDVTLAVSDSTQRIGSAVGFNGLVVPEIPGSSLEMGDLILGRPADLTWRHRGVDVPLNPLNAWNTGSPLDIYYEIGGLTPGTDYHNAISIWKADRRTLTVEFEEKAATERQAVQRTIPLEGLKRGTYRLVVTVRDRKSGEEVSREQLLHVR